MIMNDTSGLRVEAEGVGWWLDPANKEARTRLAGRKPELELWLQMIERKVNEKLAQVEKDSFDKAG